MKLHKYIILVLFAILLLESCGDPHYVPADYRIFKNTPVWDLAKAVRANDSKRIRYLVEEKGMDVNYQEEEYGFTVLCCAMTNSDNMLNMGEIKLGTIETLLEVGADPNLYGSPSQRGENAVIIACSEGYVDGLKILLEHGGDPNSRKIREGVWATDESAIISSNIVLNKEETTIECIKLLLKYGADINTTTPYYKGGIIESCIEARDYKVLLFVLEQGADINVTLTSVGYRKDGKPIPLTLVESLRECLPKIGSESFYNKRKVVDFLISKGIDYENTPIPDYVMKNIKKLYPDNWQEYVSIY